MKFRPIFLVLLCVVSGNLLIVQLLITKMQRKMAVNVNLMPDSVAVVYANHPKNRRQPVLGLQFPRFFVPADMGTRYGFYCFAVWR